MEIKLIKSTFIDEELAKNELAKFILSSERLSMSSECKKFENSFSNYHGLKHGCLVNSGSSANLLLIQALINLKKLKKGDFVGVSALTWSTNVMPLIQLGLKPIPIDIKLENLNLDINSLKSIYREFNLKCLFLTNLLGFCSKLDDLVDFCNSNKIILIEDNCESLGTRYQAKLLGTFGIASTCSFFVGHHLSTIEGGIVITDDEELNDALIVARAHGWSRNLSSEKAESLKVKFNTDDFYNKYTFYELGFNLRPTEITGFLGNHQINYLENIIEKRENNFKIFNSSASKNKELIKLEVSHIDTISNFAFPLVFKEKSSYIKYRDKFKKANVEIRPIVSGNISDQPFFKKYSSINKNLKNAVIAHQTGFYFPNNPELSNEEIEYLKNLLK